MIPSSDPTRRYESRIELAARVPLYGVAAHYWGKVMHVRGHFRVRWTQGRRPEDKVEYVVERNAVKGF